MDADAGTRHRRRTATTPDRRKAPRRRTDVHEPASVRFARDAALALLDRLNRGVVLLDEDGAVCFANRAAEAMVARNDGLLLRSGRLQFNDTGANAALEAFLRNGRCASDSGSLVLRVDGTELEQPYRVLVSRLAPRQDRCAQVTGYSALIYEPNGGQRPLPLQVLKQLYGLTTGEAQLANELFLGRSLTESAHARGITLFTAKSVLKSIFAKCAVGSQAELLLLLSLGPRTL